MDLDGVVGLLFAVIYMMRTLPEKDRPFQQLTTMCIVCTIVAVLMKLRLPVPEARVSYLFFLMHAINIYDEHERHDKGRVRHAPLAFSYFSLLLIAYGICATVRGGGNDDSKYNVDEDNE